MTSPRFKCDRKTKAKIEKKDIGPMTMKTIAKYSKKERKQRCGQCVHFFACNKLYCVGPMTFECALEKQGVGNKFKKKE